MKRLFTFGAAAAALLTGQAFAEETPPEAKSTLALVLENDSLSSGADRNYTSGVMISYVSPVNVMPKWVRGLDDFTRATTNTRPSLWGVSLGQSIFTPVHIDQVPAPRDEHPYAGWLYAQVLIAAEENVIAREPRYIDLYALEFGIVGESALGRQSQRGIHQALNAPDPKGWDSQLKDEPAFALTLERRWRALALLPDAVPGDLEADISPGVTVTAGNLRTEAKVGASVRIGQHLSRDYGAPRVPPALGGLGWYRADHRFSWYVFGGVDVRGVARNIFLDGNTWRDSVSVNKRPLVLDVQAGVAVQTGEWRLAYTYVTRSEEFESQNARQDFGAVAISRRF